MAHKPRAKARGIGRIAPRFAFCGFPEPWYCPTTKKIMPGFEIFFDTSLKLEDCEPVLLMEKDWEENMDASLFENVYVLEDGDEIEPIGLIRSSNSPLQNWYLAEESSPMHLESETESESESESESNSSLYESESSSDESEPDYPRPPCVTFHFDVNTEFGNIMHNQNLACSASYLRQFSFCR